MAVSAEPRTRRALLGAGVGALVATAANALGRASPVDAQDENIQVGHEYATALTQTKIRNQTTTANVFVAQAAPGGTALVGIGGATGIAGSGASTGVYANSDDGIGLDALSYFGTAVLATGTSGVAVYARNGTGDGGLVVGYSLQTNGRLKLGTSGVATIGASKTAVTVTPGVDVSSASFVLLTPMANLGGRSLWFTLDTVANKFTIRVSSSRASATKVSWLLLDKPV